MEKAFLSIENAEQFMGEMNEFLIASTKLANELAEKNENALTEREKEFSGKFDAFNDRFQKVWNK